MSTAPLKWHGGKHYLAKKIVALMPHHVHYVEPFAGGLAVLLAKPCDGYSEAVNDLDGRLVNFWRVLQDEESFQCFQRRVQAVPFSEAVWREAHAWEAGSQADPIEDAVRFFIACRQSLSGRKTAFTGITKTRTRRRMNNEVSAWLSAVEGLPEVHRRLRRVLILNRPALQVVRSQDSAHTLFYLDPPYLPETRTAPGVYGAYEMSAEDHRELLEALRRVQGKVMLSGYPSSHYRELLADWTCHEFDVPNHAAGGRQKRRMTECLWCNFGP